MAIKKINAKNWESRFNLLGSVKINEKTFFLEEVASTGFIYNRMNISVDCGPVNGNIYADCMGGYYEGGSYKISSYSKEGYSFDIDWNDRKNPDILEDVASFKFFVFKGKDGEEHKFVSGYDFIEYVEKNLNDGDIVSIWGNTKFDIYNNEVRLKQEIQRITVIDNDVPKEKYKAEIWQSVLIGKDSIGRDSDNREDHTLEFNCRVLQYLSGKIDGQKISENGTYPLWTKFKFQYSDEYDKAPDKLLNTLFKPKRGVNQVTFHGDYMFGQSLTPMTEDDLPDDIKALVDIGAIKLEDALLDVAGNSFSGGGEVIFRSVYSKKIAQGEKVSTKPMFFQNAFSEDDLDLDYKDYLPDIVDIDEEYDEDEIPFPTDSDNTDSNSMDWLNDV